MSDRRSKEARRVNTKPRRSKERRRHTDLRVAVVEIADSHVHWLSPVDLKMDDMSFVINSGRNSISSHHPNGPAVLFCDGAVFRINPSMDANAVLALCTINGGEEISREELIKEGLLIP